MITIKDILEAGYQKIKHGNSGISWHGKLGGKSIIPGEDIEIIFFQCTEDDAVPISVQVVINSNNNYKIINYIDLDPEVNKTINWFNQIEELAWLMQDQANTSWKKLQNNEDLFKS